MIDAGNNQYFIAISHPCKDGPNVPLGYMWLHFAPSGRPCSGVVRTCDKHKDVADEGAEYWTENSGLTLAPSLLCKRCNLHGFLREGRWVDAGSPVGSEVLKSFAKAAWREMSMGH